MARKKNFTYSRAPAAAVEEAVARLGANIATARLRRRMTQGELAERAGITRPTLVAVEQGKLGTGVGAYVAVLWVLGLHEQVADVAAPERDPEGIALEAARLPERARRPTDLDDDF
ncbi:MAG TPA: helix-turn-helix transcriptional regulator [Longimicrobium sp.]|nr:helix-turn-helix transcriptional regulator [Longimicrobium sp.]